jgi:histidinol-phosphate aminotransferase
MSTETHHVQPNAHLSGLPVYEPGRPIEDVARDLGHDPGAIIKLASNENPWGPSPLALQALRDVVSQVHIYPDGNGFKLRQAIARKHKLEIEQVVLGNGSNEIIEFLGHAYLRPGTGIVISQYAFAIYEIVGRMFQADISEVPAREFGHDLEAMLMAIKPETRLVFVANPNNPTGTTLSADELRAFIGNVPASTLVVIDEAYQEFLGNPLDTAALVQCHPNLVIMRTFSKAQGLAGLRIGYGLGSREVIQNLQKVRQPFQANLPAQVAALAALGDEEHIRRTVSKNREGMKFFESELAKRKLRFVPSSGNFVMMEVGNGRNVFDDLLKQGLIVRPLGGYRLPTWIRVTIGTPEQNNRFFAALDKALAN